MTARAARARRAPPGWRPREAVERRVRALRGRRPRATAPGWTAARATPTLPHADRPGAAAVAPAGGAPAPPSVEPQRPAAALAGQRSAEAQDPHRQPGDGQRREPQ